MKKNTKKGFTLVELLVVIAILAILASVAVVGYTSFINKANNSACEQEIAQVKTQVTSNDIVGDYSEYYVLTSTSFVWTFETAPADEAAAKTTIANAIKAMAPELPWDKVTLTINGTYTAANGTTPATFSIASVVYARDGGSATWTIA